MGLVDTNPTGLPASVHVLAIFEDLQAPKNAEAAAAVYGESDAVVITARTRTYTACRYESPTCWTCGFGGAGATARGVVAFASGTCVRVTDEIRVTADTTGAAAARSLYVAGFLAGDGPRGALRSLISTPRGAVASGLDSDPVTGQWRSTTSFDLAASSTPTSTDAFVYQGSDAALDVDGDSRFSGHDASALEAMIGAPSGSDPANTAAWDFDGSGFIDAPDVALLGRLLDAGLDAGKFGDADGDGDVDCIDSCVASVCWGSTISDANYRAAADADLDGDNDATDRAAFIAAACPADFDRSGNVTVEDFFNFLAAYFAQEISADFNRSGDITLQDMFDFLVAYFEAPHCQ